MEEIIGEGQEGGEKVEKHKQKGKGKMRRKIMMTKLKANQRAYV